MYKMIVVIMFCGFLFSQDENSIFHEVSKEEISINKIKYPDWVLSIGGGYMIHETKKTEDLFFRTNTSYDNNYNLEFSVSRYFFQGTYLTLSLVSSKTVERYIGDGTIDPQKSTAFDTLITSSRNFSYLSPSLSITHYFLNDLEFKAPWYFSVGFGSNIFSGDDGYNRFSVNFLLGKIFPRSVLGSHFYVNLAASIYEDRGVREVYYDSNTFNARYIQRFEDFVTYFNLRLNVGLAFDFIN
jgi:hypothetical protein